MIFRLCLFFLSFCPVMAAAQMNYYQVEKKEPPAKPAEGGFGVVVTPVDSCFQKFEEKEIHDMRKNFERPYHECLRRLAETEAAEKKAAAEKEAKPDPADPKQNPFHYRVRKPKPETDKAQADEKQEKTDSR